MRHFFLRAQAIWWLTMRLERRAVIYVEQSDRMKKIFQIVLSLVPAFFLSSCVDEYSYFEHPPTKYLLKNVSVEDFDKESKFLDRGILFVPHFRKLTDSFTKPQSFLRFYSLNETQLFISKAVLTAGSKSFEYEIDVDKAIEFTYLDENDGYLSAGLKLFDIGAVDLSKVLKEKSMTCTLRYKINGVESSMSFELLHKTSKDIAWAT